jgi:hypothetical protein
MSRSPFAYPSEVGNVNNIYHAFGHVISRDGMSCSSIAYPSKVGNAHNNALTTFIINSD